MLNLRSGKYHGLNATAARMLELLERERRIPAVAEQLAEEYGRTTTEMQDDLCRLCRSLLERGLIEISSNGGA